MVRYLSTAWFDRLRDDTEGVAAPHGASDALVLRHVVRPDAAAPGATGADDRRGADYDVVIEAGRAVIRHPPIGPADLTFTSDYPTAAAIAAGQLSTQAALAEGRLRVAGDVNILARRAADVSGLDPVPAGLRAETEY
jgi:hypothetical protein